jgi:hypothetical protein
MVFHSEGIRVNGYYQTSGCNKMNVSGFCLGHKISRRDFLERYCAGIEPEAKRNKE